MKIIAEIAEVHKVIVELDVPPNATRQEMEDAAAKQRNGSEVVEYSHILPPGHWVIRKEDGSFILPNRHVFGDKWPEKRV